jgi:hypothetical protein
MGIRELAKIGVEIKELYFNYFGKVDGRNYSYGKQLYDYYGKKLIQTKSKMQITIDENTKITFLTPRILKKVKMNQKFLMKV